MLAKIAETPRKPFPWWAVAVAVLFMAIAVGAALFIFDGDGPELVDVVGDTPAVARERLIEAGFEDANITEEVGPPIGQEPGTVAEARLSAGGADVVLVIDPGVVVRAPLHAPLETTVANLTADGLVPNVSRIPASDVAFFLVETANPADGATVRLGASVSLTTFVPDPDSQLIGAEWIVEDINGGGVVDNSRATITFRQDGQVHGSGSCNNYASRYTLSGERLAIEEVGATSRACAPPIMEQESRFFAALASTTRFEITADRALVLHGANGERILARRP